MDNIEHSGPTCNRCGVLYAADYEGSCQEEGCGGWVSWEATVDRLAVAFDRLVVSHQGAVDALEWIGARPIPDGNASCATEIERMKRVARLALEAGGQ